MAGIFSNLRGVLADLFQIGGPTGVNLKHNTGVLEVRDSGDTAFVIARGADAVSDDDLINVRTHRALRDLIHFIDQGPADGFASGAYKETTYTGPLIGTETWYEDNTKTQKIVELLVTYTGVFPTSEVWKMYDTDGTTVLVTLTDSIVYSGPFEQTRTRTWA